MNIRWNLRNLQSILISTNPQPSVGKLFLLFLERALFLAGENGLKTGLEGM